MKRDAIEMIWKQLSIEREETAHQPLVDLFAADEGRFAAFSAGLDDLLLDFSKTALS